MTDQAEEVTTKTIEPPSGPEALARFGSKVLKFAPLMIFVLGLGLRLFGITWGLPNDLHHQSYHPDEEVIWRYAQEVQPARLDFTPGFYNYGTLYLTALRVSGDMAAVYGGKKPETDPPTSPQVTDWQWVRNCHLSGRLISALAGAFSGVFVFLLLRDRINGFGAVCGGLLMALAPAFVMHSRFQTVDVLATMFLIASAWQALKLFSIDAPVVIVEGGGLAARFKQISPITWSAVLAGLSAGTKYTGFLALFTLLVAIWLNLPRSVRMKQSLIAIGTTFLAFFIATPGALLESSAFIRDFKFEMLHTSTGHGMLFEGIGSGFIYHLANLGQGLGPIAVLMGAGGLIYGCVKKEKWLWALLAFALPYYVLIGRAEVLFLRYTFPLYLILACGFGFLISKMHEAGGWKRFFPVLGIIALGNGLKVSALFTSWMVGPDPRDQAAEYIKQNSTAQTTVGLVSDPWYYTPALFPDSALSRMAVLMNGRPVPGYLYQLLEIQKTSAPKVLRYLPGDSAKDRIDWDVRLLTEARPDYVVFSSFEVGDVARLTTAKTLTSDSQKAVDNFKAFQAELEKSYEVRAPMDMAKNGDLAFRYAAASNIAHDLMYVRPVIWLWKRK
ncbi:MAG: glycosyltransferase family 39 protein [Fimbriimonadaceae bacterium]